VNQLRRAVIDVTEGKHWVFNPELARMVSSQVQQWAIEDRGLLQSLQREQERLEWLDECSTEYLIELLLPVLSHHWLTDGPMEIHEGYEVLPEEIAERLGARGFKYASDRAMLKKDGVLGCLQDIRSRHQAKRSVGEHGKLWRMVDDTELRSYVTLGLLAVKVYPLNLTPADERRLQALRQKVADSLKREAVDYARPAINDSLIGRLFPEMRDSLALPFGTREDLRAKSEARQKKKTEEASEREAAIRSELAEQMKEYGAKQELRQKVEALLLREGVDRWTQGASLNTIETVLKQRDIVRLIGNYARSEMNVESLLRDAWDSRARGQLFRKWFNDQSMEDPVKASMVLHALKMAGLLS
jgi:hypothetical protein